MAGTVTEAPKALSEPVDWMAHEMEKDRRRQEHEERLPAILECMDPETAAEYEARKPLIKYRVRCFVMERNQRGKMTRRDITAEVKAQNESEAWAKFCDQQGKYPPPKACNRTIEKVKKTG